MGAIKGHYRESQYNFVQKEDRKDVSQLSWMHHHHVFYVMLCNPLFALAYIIILRNKEIFIIAFCLLFSLLQSQSPIPALSVIVGPSLLLEPTPQDMQQYSQRLGVQYNKVLTLFNILLFVTEFKIFVTSLNLRLAMGNFFFLKLISKSERIVSYINSMITLSR